MITETIKYTDYNGTERTEQFCFNLSKAECIEMELGTEGGMEEFIRRIVDEKDNKKIVEMFKKILLKSYGEKSPDGKYFRKSPEISSDFASTEAYTELFMKLASDADYAAKFITGILPRIPKEELDSIEASSKSIVSIDKG